MDDNIPTDNGYINDLLEVIKMDDNRDDHARLFKGISWALTIEIAVIIAAIYIYRWIVILLWAATK